MYRRYFFKTFERNNQNMLRNNLLNHRWLDSVYRGDYPAINITSDDDETRIEAAIPGVPKDDILLELEGDILTISVDKNELSESNFPVVFVGRERAETRFARSVELGADSDLENISADYSDGILIVRVPKLKAIDSDRRVINIS